MKKQKALCATHNKNILFMADSNPMCSQCDYESYWVFESFQADQELKYSKSQQKSNIIKLLAQYKRKLSALLMTFDLIKNQQIDKLDNHVELYLDQNYNIDLMMENIQQIDNLQTMLNKLVDYNNNLTAKIATIIYPKDSKLMSLNNESKQQRRPQEKIQMENQDQAFVEIQKQEEKAQPQVDYDDDVEQRFIQIPTRNIYCDEQYFYQKANASLFGCPIFDELISKKLDINMAPKQLYDLDREHNLYEVFTDDKIKIFGYSQNYLLNGRGIIMHENYIENGYYIKGILVWGQIFSLVANNIIYEEIDNTELLDAIDLYENQQMLWNRWHYIRITNQQ